MPKEILTLARVAGKRLPILAINPARENPTGPDGLIDSPYHWSPGLSPAQILTVACLPCGSINLC